MRCFVALAGCSIVWQFSVVFAADAPVRFNRDIRPIMSDTCFRCHGPDKSSRMAGMRLDIRDEALRATKSGVTPIVPGDPEKSAIVQRVLSADPRKVMPPKYAHKELTEAQKETIRRWVAEGAKYEGHWSYQPVTRPSVPAIGDSKLIRNPIDAFIQDRLRTAGLEPSAVADPRTLIRRVSLDLTGLPPSPEDVAAFVKDPSPEAYDKLVDRLLASPAFAERQAMFWLDAVRYADSAGFHGDNLWPVWPYRDYVLRAFRDNMPFDRFTREQLAGDLLPDPTRDQLIATAFNRLNRASAEGGIQPKEYLAKYGADRVRTISSVWMGATMGCAECHDHKFDPFTAKDFYSMKAFFADVRETGLVSDRGAKAWGSKLVLASDEQTARLKQMDDELEDAKKQLHRLAEARMERRFDWEQRMLDQHASGDLAWKYQRPMTASAANGATLTIANDEPVDFNYYLNGSLASERKPGGGLIIASGANPDNETYTVQLKPGPGTWTSIGIDVHQDESLPGNRVSRGADRFVLTEVEADVSSPGSQPKKLQFVLATSTGFGEPQDQPAMAAIDNDANTGWGMSFGEHRNPFLALRLGEKLETTADSVITLRLHHDSAYRRATIGRFRIALATSEYSWPETGDSGKKHQLAEKSKEEIATLNVAVDRGLPPELLRILQKEEGERSDSEKQAVLEAFEWSAPEFQNATIRVAKLETQRALFDAAIPRVLVTERMRPRVTRVLPRGDFLNESGAVVLPAIPAFLGTVKTGGRATRLDLANWLVSKDNPLTARVFVNRKWRELFGVGLSKVLEDLGSQGEWPTHLELLDWLASEFMQPEGGSQSWDVKHLIRLMVTSHTYRQASTSTPELDQKDPDNRLLARQARFRVDAETVHDVALAASGLLVQRFGGPSVKPLEPAGYLAAMNFPKREYSASRGDDLYRRAVYTEWQRTFLHPSLLTFDAPTREECTVNRVSSNTPLQALVLLNDPIFLEAARALAHRALAEGGRKMEDQLDWAFERALSRPPSKQERKVLADLYRAEHKRYEAAESDAGQLVAAGSSVQREIDPRDLAAMTVVARTILNLHEVITRN